MKLPGVSTPLVYRGALGGLRWGAVPRERLEQVLPCVWLRDQWVGLDPTRILGTEPTHSLFGCTSDFGDGVNPFHVWLKELGIRVGWHDNTVNEGPIRHQ